MMSLSEKLLITDELASKNIPVFWLEHDRVGRWLTQNPWLSELKRQSNSATTICVSNVSKKIYLDMGWNPQNVVSIPNGIDLSRFSNITKPARNARPRFGCVARLSQEKGVDVLIQAAAAMPEIDVDIVGTGPDENYLRKMIEMIQEREHVEESRIKIHSHVENLGDFYSHLDVLVLPSRDNDPFGLVAAEAMSMGIPVIVTSACGIADYLRNGEDAVIVSPNSERSLSDAMKKLLDPNIRARIGSTGKQTAHERFGVSRMIDAYEALLLKK
jgi:glycosyltransferase involved in cell wall biosynthesis